MTIPKDNSQLETARQLRREMTPQERKLWYLFLRTYPVKVYKQRIIGKFIVDFYCASAKLVIEVDGSQHYDPSKQENDRKRTEYLSGYDILVLRIPNNEVMHNFSGVCQFIDYHVNQRLCNKGPLA